MKTKGMLLLRLVLVVCLLWTQSGLPQSGDSAVAPVLESNESRVLPDALADSIERGRVAFNSMTSEEREALFKKVAPYFEAALMKAQRENGAYAKPDAVDKLTEIGMVGWDGTRRKVAANKTPSKLLQNVVGKSFGGVEGIERESAPALDMAAMSMPQSFLENLAELFTPYYHVSNGETDQFAAFHNYVPTTVKQLYGQNPLSYYRVHPLGFTVNNGIQYGFFKINYLSLWNNDSGLYVSGDAYQMLLYVYQYMPYFAALFSVLDGLGGHALDDEHSAVLVGAPTTGSYVYNSNPAAYYVYSAYAAAHEDTQSDHSTYTYPEPPAQGHVELLLGLRKHGSYFGNPNGLPLAPSWAIDSCFLTAQQLYLQGLISWNQFNSLTYCFSVLFYECMVERFYLGGVQGFAYPRINVGEPVAGEILNDCGFILDPNHVLPKLQRPIWQGFTPAP